MGRRLILDTNVWLDWLLFDDPSVAALKAGDRVKARSWLQRIRRHNPNYRLFLKHFSLDKMPPTERDGLLFVDDSQIFPGFEAMVEEFESCVESEYDQEP